MILDRFIYKPKLNILYVLYQDFNCNSAIHVHNFANSIAGLGNECIVSVPNNKNSFMDISSEPPLYIPAEYQEIAGSKVTFSDNKDPDIIHVWTPREITRIFHSSIKNRFKNSRLVIHLEDNEDLIFEKQANMSQEQVKELSEDQLNNLVNSSLSHPIRYKDFLEQADGMTVIIDTLCKFIPKGTPSMVLWPIIDPAKFTAKPKDNALLRELGINNDPLIICYTGNVHRSNTQEVRSLYTAVALANEEGIPIKLIRTGNDYCDFLGDDIERLHKYSVELGHVKYEEIPSLLALADILIQPGGPDEFNDYRLPSKIPEYLAAGKPVVAPNTNIGRYLRNNKNAMITEKGDEFEILDAIRALSGNKPLRERLSRGGREFAIKHFDKKRISSDLERFYRRVSRKRSWEWRKADTIR